MVSYTIPPLQETMAHGDARFAIRSAFRRQKNAIAAIKRTQLNIVEKYSYSVVWSQEDECFVGTCAEFPLVSALADSRVSALEEILFVVKESVAWMQEEGETIPEPYSLREFSGKLSLRIPSKLHRQIAIEAAKANISISKYINAKLAE